MNDEEFIKEMMQNENGDIDPEEEGHLGLYLQELEELPVYEGDALRVLKMNVLAGRNEAKRSLTEHYMHHVVQVARLYLYQGVKFSELISEGNMGLWHFIKNIPAETPIESMDELVTKAIMESMEAYVAEVKEASLTVEYRPTEFATPEDLLAAAKQMEEPADKKIRYEGKRG